MDELNRQTRELGEDVKHLASQVGLLDDRLAKTDRDKRWLFVGLLLVVALVGFVGFVAFRAENIASDQEQLRAEVLCPLYSIFLGSYNPDSRPEGDARRKYEDAYREINRGWDIMDCRLPVVPARSDR